MKFDNYARAAIVSIAEKNNLFFVVWTGHFGRYFKALKCTKKLKPEIYSAIYESYYDLVEDAEEVFQFNLPDFPFTWEQALLVVKAFLPSSRKVQNDIAEVQREAEVT